MMTTTEPQVVPNGRYNITQTAAALGVNRCTITRWVEAGRLKPRYERYTKRARFRGIDILNLWRAEC